MNLPLTPRPHPDSPSVVATGKRRFHRRRQMQSILDAERVRADRHGHVVSIVTFDLPGRASALRYGSLLRRTLLEGCRLTDAIGWADSRRAIAVLPYTDAEPAMVMANRIRDELGEFGERLRIVVHTYPHNFEGDGPGPDDGERAGLIEPLPESAAACAIDLAAREITPVLQTVGPQWRFTRGEPLWKRTLDIVGSAALLVALSPVMLAAAIAIKLTSRGPVIFRQQRSGLYGEPFTILKFRTMTVDAEARKKEVAHLDQQDGPTFKIPHDPRVTPLGRFLRRTSIDELPQLINVLRGEMSLVGPRPLDVREAVRCEHWHRQRLDVVPGITCIWQVTGRPRDCFDQWARMDIRYVRHRTLLHDLKLLLLTIPAVVKQSDTPW